MIDYASKFVELNDIEINKTEFYEDKNNVLITQFLRDNWDSCMKYVRHRSLSGKEVLEGVLSDKSFAELADELGLSVSSVRDIYTSSVKYVKDSLYTSRLAKFAKQYIFEVFEDNEEMCNFFKYYYEVSSNTINALHRAGITGKQDILNLTYDELIKIRGIGDVGAKEVIDLQSKMNGTYIKETPKITVQTETSKRKLVEAKLKEIKKLQQEVKLLKQSNTSSSYSATLTSLCRHSVVKFLGLKSSTCLTYTIHSTGSALRRFVLANVGLPETCNFLYSDEFELCTQIIGCDEYMDLLKSRIIDKEVVEKVYNNIGYESALEKYSFNKDAQQYIEALHIKEVI